MAETANIKIHGKILKDWQKKMLVDGMFPTYNDGVLMVYALDVVDEVWEGIKNQKSEDRFERFYEQFMKRIKKLQKQGKLPAELKKMRDLEEIKNAK